MDSNILKERIERPKIEKSIVVESGRFKRHSSFKYGSPSYVILNHIRLLQKKSKSNNLNVTFALEELAAAFDNKYEIVTLKDHIRRINKSLSGGGNTTKFLCISSETVRTTNNLRIVLKIGRPAAEVPVKPK